MSVVIKTCGILMESTNRPMQQIESPETDPIYMGIGI